MSVTLMAAQSRSGVSPWYWRPEAQMLEEL